MLRYPVLAAAFLAALLASSPLRAETSWIWAKKNNVSNQEVWARGSFELAKVPAKVELLASADNHCVVWVNGKQVGGTDEWQQPLKADVAAALKAGRNTIAVLIQFQRGPLRITR